MPHSFVFSASRLREVEVTEGSSATGAASGSQEPSGSSRQGGGPGWLPALPGRWRWADAAALLGLLALTTLVVLVYAWQPRSPGELGDRMILFFDPEAYGASLRTAVRDLESGRRAEARGDEERADSLYWRAAHRFRRTAEFAPGPRAEGAANDRAARIYLRLGREYLGRGEGRLFGFGRDRDAMERAERAAACMVGLAPTRMRATIDRFIQELESALERPLAAECPG